MEDVIYRLVLLSITLVSTVGAGLVIKKLSKDRDTRTPRK